jgi:hypothetical protein
MMAHPLALQLRNLQTLVEVAVDKNSTVVFPAPLMSTIAELGSFLERESKAAGELPAALAPPTGPQMENRCPMTATNQPDRSPAPGTIHARSRLRWLLPPGSKTSRG